MEVSGQLHAQAVSLPGKETPGVNLTVCLDAVAKRKNPSPPLPGIENYVFCAKLRKIHLKNMGRTYST
jgi:hypothetical protein